MNFDAHILTGGRYKCANFTLEEGQGMAWVCSPMTRGYWEIVCHIKQHEYTYQLAR